MIVDVKRLRQERRAAGLTQRELARISDLSVRTIKMAEGHGRVGVVALRKLAEALGVFPVQLLTGYEKPPPLDGFPRFLLQQVIPTKRDPGRAEILRRGAVADMRSDFGMARTLFEEALKAERIDEDFNDKAQLIVKLATTLDNSGQHEMAIHKLDAILDEAGRRKLRPWIVNWVRYHLGLSHRRLAEQGVADREKRLKRAEEEFRRLLREGKPNQITAATHQLGVVAWVRAMGIHSLARRDRLLSEARRRFRKAARDWRGEGNFREGYALRRLADIAQLEGDIHETYEMLLDALEVFVRHDCHRYRLEVREHLRRLHPDTRRRRREGGQCGRGTLAVRPGREPRSPRAHSTKVGQGDQRK